MPYSAAKSPLYSVLWGFYNQLFQQPGQRWNYSQCYCTEMNRSHLQEHLCPLLACTAPPWRNGFTLPSLTSLTQYFVWPEINGSVLKENQIWLPFSMCTSPSRRFYLTPNLRWKRDYSLMGWPSMQIIMFLTWKLLLFLLCSAFRMKELKAFQQSQYQPPRWEMPSKSPFSAVLRCRTQVRKQRNVAELRTCTHWHRW